MQSAPRLLDVARFDASAYGAHDVPAETLLNWWQAFPVGVRIAEGHDGEILGSMSAWPLHIAAYHGVSSGWLPESSLTPAHFDIDSYEKTRWYISGIAIAPQLRTSARFMLAFLLDGLAQLRSEARTDAPDMCAVATSREGARMLARFGFEQRADRAHGLVFERRAFRDERMTALAGTINA